MKAIALISGGLDSTLATKLVQGLGLELVALNTVSPFCLCNHRSSKGCLHGAQAVAKDLGIRLISINVAEELLEIVKNPPHGYGSNMNPCIDCRILLFKKAREFLQKEGASFIITGEVLAQRPMSQRRDTMRLIERESGLDGLVLRPLSAKVLEPTIPEQKGWVSRDSLLAINGRGRKEQISLAQNLGINDYPCPSGGCLLTDPEFSRRMKDLIKQQQVSLENVNLLKIGRHFRLGPKTKLVVGRNERENGLLVNFAKTGDYLISAPPEVAGPTCLGKGEFNEELVTNALGIACYYCDDKEKVSCQRVGEGQGQVFAISPLDKNEIARLRI